MISSASCTNSTGDKNLTFLYLTSFTGLFLTSGSIPATEMALETINSDQSLLPGYNLQFVAKDSQVLYVYYCKCQCRVLLYGADPVVTKL